MDMCLLKFNNYQSTVAPNCFKSHTNSWCFDFFQKISLHDVRSEIHLVRRFFQTTSPDFKIIFRHVLAVKVFPDKNVLSRNYLTCRLLVMISGNKLFLRLFKRFQNNVYITISHYTFIL